MEMLAVFIILASVLALVATILAFIFIVPEKKRARLNKFGKFLHDTVNFKYLIIEKILQTLYILATAFDVLLGFFLLFYVEPGYSNYYYSSPSVWFGGYGLLIMIVGPIAIRLVYEGLMMGILLIKNVIQINNKMKVEGEANKGDIFAGPEIEKDGKPSTSFCQNCGKKVRVGAFCSHCGAKLS